MKRGRKLVYGAAVAVAALALLEGLARWLPGAPRAADLAAVAFAQAGESNLLVPDPDLFWRLRPDLDVAFSGTRVRTNSLGFRGPEPAAPAVVAVGDSVTFGYLVEEPEAFPAVLGRRTGLEVLNAGVPAYSSDQGRKLLTRLLGRFAPRFVVISFGYNDARLFPFADAEAVRGGRARLQALLGRSVLVGRVRAALGEALPVTRAASLLDVRAANLAGFPPGNAAAGERFLGGEERIRAILASAPERVPLSAYGDNLRAMIREARAHGAVPILVAPPFARPSREPYFAASWHRTPVARYREAMRAVARAEAVAYVELAELCEQTSDPEAYFVTRPMAPGEAEFYRAWLSLERRRELGVSDDLERRTDLVHPGAKGQLRLGEAVAAALGGQDSGGR